MNPFAALILFFVLIPINLHQEAFIYVKLK